MMILGNIVGDIINIPKYFSNDSKIVENIPNLIIGWKRAKVIFPKQFRISNKAIENNIFWCHSKRSDRMDYLNSFKAFIQHCIKYRIDSFTYTFIDPIVGNMELLTSDYKSVLFCDNVLYYRKEKSILGLDANPDKYNSYVKKDNMMSEKKLNPDFLYLKGYRKLCF